MRIGFIGLGTMGLPMAANLVRAGFAVTAYNRHAEKARELVAMGAKLADSPAAAARGAEAVIVMVSDNAAVREVVLGPGGVADGVSAGMLLIDMSTVLPEVNRELAAALADNGVMVIDAPVVGSVKPATEGTLIILAGGEQAAYERSLPVLQAMGKQIIRAGPLGAGNHLKLCINLLLGNIMEAVAESITLAEKGGVSRKHVLDILGSGALNSPWFHTKLPNFLNNDFTTAFALKHVTKDLSYALEQGCQYLVPLPATAAAAESFKAAQNHGLGELDMSAILCWVKEAAGEQK